jgi:hypothetical protein
MTARHPLAVAALTTFLTAGVTLISSAVPAPNNDCDPANPIIKWCATSDTTIAVYFNPGLDPLLETQFGNAVTRQASFNQAVNDWNAALATVNSRVKLQPVIDPNKWGVDQGQPRCNDLEVPPPAPQVFDDASAHFGDGINATSTGHNHTGRVDALANLIGPGWILPFGQLVSDTGETVPVDGVLAYTTVQIDNNKCITEGDIAWLTHRNVFGVGCKRLPWDYDLMNGPAGTRYDFYSVMLHELGHFLGLGHQEADPAGTNVMQEAIGKGKRRIIGPKERACLCALYAGPGVNCAQVTDARHSTWGRLKTIYR